MPWNWKPKTSKTRPDRTDTNLLWITTFNTMEELQAALQKFKDDDNEHRLIQRHGHRSPNQFRRDAMDKIPTAA